MQTFTMLRRRQAGIRKDDSGRNILKIGCDLLVAQNVHTQIRNLYIIFNLCIFYLTIS